MQLCLETLESGNAEIFDYDRSTITAGIVHLGVGAFHRAHQAAYVDSTLGEDPSWGITGASLRNSTVANALNPQDGLYTLAINSAAGTRHRIIGSLIKVIDASVDPEPLLNAMVDPAIRIVSLTITEKGYCINPATSNLDFQHPDIIADLAHPDKPRSAIGIIVEALKRRAAADTGPFTVLSCDNLSDNGTTIRKAVSQLASQQDPGLADWIAEHVTFPCTMVDRIVPATTPAQQITINTATGFDDQAPVATEPFCQWVVEDNFCAGRPSLEKVGVEFVDDVSQFELMKLRMLNGSHSTLAYLGYLAGYETISDAMKDPELAKLIHDMMTLEVIPTLNMPDDGYLFDYRDMLIDRFRNPALQHRTWQIAMDGSKKLPQRLLGTIRDRLASNVPFERLALGVAGWMRYVTGFDKSGNPIDVRDPLASQLKEIGKAHGDRPADLVNAYVAVSSVFGDDLPRNSVFISTVTEALAKV